jgi:hypothetical protein
MSDTWRGMRVESRSRVRLADVRHGIELSENGGLRWSDDRLVMDGWVRDSNRTRKHARKERYP